MPLPPKRPTHASAVSLHGHSVAEPLVRSNNAGRTVKSADSVAIRPHSVGFRHDDDSTSYRSDDSDVVDIRDSGMVSLGSAGSSIDGRAARELFRVSGGGHGGGSGGDRRSSLVSVGVGVGGGGMPEGEANPPEHWQSSSLEQRRAPRMAIQQTSMDESLPGERAQAYAALMSMVHGAGSNVSEMDNDNGGGMRRITSFASLNTGFWSAMAFQRSGSSHPDSDDQMSKGSDKSGRSNGSKGSIKSDGSGSEYSTKVTYGKERRRLRRQLFLRKCAKVMVAFLALAALSMSAVYYVGKDNFLQVVDIQLQKYHVLLRARRESFHNNDRDDDDALPSKLESAERRRRRAQRQEQRTRKRAQRRDEARRAPSPQVGDQYSPEDGGVDYSHVP